MPRRLPYEHAHGKERERLQKAARKAAG